MEQPPLRLADYFLTKLSIEPNFEAAASADIDVIDPEPKHLDLSIEYNFEEVDDDDAAIYIWLNIKNTDESAKKGVRYIFNMDMAARYYCPLSFYKESTSKFIDDVLVRDCVSILFGHSREKLSNITGGMPLGRMILPTVNLAGHTATQQSSDETN